MGKYDELFKPIKIGNRTCSNRFCINAMETNNADDEGNPTDKTYSRYERLFKGNAGLIDLEAITVTRESRGRLHQLSIEPHNAKAIAKFVKSLKEVNNKPLFVFQLTHAGELSRPEFSRRVTIKPLPGFIPADQLTEEDVEEIMKKYETAAKIAYESGADGLDLKYCHGYLGSQILRPYNDRKWKYGGPWENRRQYAFDLVERVQKAVNYDENFIIGAKVSAWEGFPGGQGTVSADSPIMDLTETFDLIKGIEERGAKYILQSAGSPSITLSLSQPDRRIPDYAYLDFYFQKEIKKIVKPETVVIGSGYSVFREGKNLFQGVDKPAKSSLVYWGEKNISEGVVDMIAIGRQSFADPELPIKLEEGRENEIKWCTTCDHCMEIMIHQHNVGCCTYEKEYAQDFRQIRKESGRLKEFHT